MTFADLGLAEPILRAVTTEGYSEPTPIQARAIPVALEGRDLFGCAQTGTGKTAAFALPLLHRLCTARPTAGAGRRIRALVLSPTRELAAQIGESLASYGRNTPLRSAVIFGGVNQNPQVRALQKGIDILVATPGRLLDLMNQGHVDLRSVGLFVLDEADRMLDLGFFPDIRRIVAKLPVERQTMLFSATMPDDIKQLAQSILREPATVQVTPVSSTAERVEQAVYHVSRRHKSRLLEHLLLNTQYERVLVFTRTKRRADRVASDLMKSGLQAAAIHGDKTQAQRERALGRFRTNRLPILVATDIAARGIDVDCVSHVYNFDVHEVAETYVHRIGRTARAGASGTAVSFCDVEERGDLKAIERLIRQAIPVRHDHPEYPQTSGEPAAQPVAAEAEATDRPRAPGKPHSQQRRDERRPGRGRSENSRERRPHSGAKPSRSGRSQGQRHSGNGNGQSNGNGATGGNPFAQPTRTPHAEQARRRRRRPRRGNRRPAAAAAE